MILKALCVGDKSLKWYFLRNVELRFGSTGVKISANTRYADKDTWCAYAFVWLATPSCLAFSSSSERPR